MSSLNKLELPGKYRTLMDTARLRRIKAQWRRRFTATDDQVVDWQLVQIMVIVLLHPFLGCGIGAIQGNMRANCSTPAATSNSPIVRSTYGLSHKSRRRASAGRGGGPQVSNSI